MARFAVRRLFAMIVVLFLISVLTFLLFEAIPNGDPALRLAGRLATATEIQEIRHKFGFDQPIYVQYARTMKNIFTGQAYSYSQGFNVLDEIKAGLPATLSLALGRGHHLAAVLDRRRHDRRNQGWANRRPGADCAVDDRRLLPAVLPRRGADLLPRLQGEHLPAGRLREVHHQSHRSGLCT